MFYELDNLMILELVFFGSNFFGKFANFKQANYGKDFKQENQEQSN